MKPALRGAAALKLPLLGSNQASPDPETCSTDRTGARAKDLFVDLYPLLPNCRAYFTISDRACGLVHRKKSSATGQRVYVPKYILPAVN
jgi:hypothetical protein